MEKGHHLGLIPERLYWRLAEKREIIEKEIQHLRTTRPRLTPEFLDGLRQQGIQGVAPDHTLAQLLRRPEIDYQTLIALGLKVNGEAGQTAHPALNGERLPPDIAEEVEILIKYEGYIQQQINLVKKMQQLEAKKIPEGFNYDKVISLSREVREKLKKINPISIGQASRISGVTPAAISLLLVALEQQRRITAGQL
jgi:tRNA uridine 5-carboxymethylaminomethyl modification enzyme